MDMPLSISLGRRFLFRRLLLLLILLTGVGAIILAAFMAKVLRDPQKTLTVDSGEVSADVAIVLGGSPEERAARAAQLYAAGDVPKIIVSGAGDTNRAALILSLNGVPLSDIIQEPDSHDTFENAANSIAICRNLGFKKIIVVTSWYHSRRALACFRSAAPEMSLYSRPSYAGYDQANSPRQVNGFARMECIKLVFYWAWHGVIPSRK